MKLTKSTGSALAAAAAVMLASGTLASDAEAGGHGKKAKGKVHCVGVNACKGKTSCKTASNACKGQNACKGKGFVTMSAEACKAIGGKIEG